MDQTTIPNTQDIQTKTQSLITMARTIRIVTQDQYVQLAEIRGGLRKLKAEVVETFAEPKDLAWKAHKSIVAAEKKHLDGIEEGIRISGNELARYDTQQQAIQRAAEEKARKEADAKARIEFEARTKEEEERQLKIALELDQNGFQKEADEILEEPVHVEAVVPEIDVPVFTPPKVQGLSYRTDYDFEIADARMIPREFLMVDEKAIRGVVKAMKLNTKIPGVKVVEKKIPLQR